MSINVRNKIVLKLFGQRLKRLRIEKKPTQELLAYEADVEQSQINRIENAKTNATPSNLSAIANALNISLSDLLKGV